MARNRDRPAGARIAGSVRQGGVASADGKQRVDNTSSSRDRAATRRRALRLAVTRVARLPAPSRLPGLAAIGSTVVATGGLDDADASVATVTRVVPGPSDHIGVLPRAVHDAGAAALGRHAYVFGGGTSSGPIDTIVRVSATGATSVVGSLPVAMSDTTAAVLDKTIYVIGGYTIASPQHSVLAFRPGRPLRDVATLPHALRYAAAAAVGDRILVAGGTDGANARAEVLSVDPATGRVGIIAKLPTPLAHAAGAALDGQLLVIGGRGNAPDAQRRAIWAIAPNAPRPRLGALLPSPCRTCPRSRSAIACSSWAGGTHTAASTTRCSSSGEAMTLATLPRALLAMELVAGCDSTTGHTGCRRPPDTRRGVSC